MSTVVIITEATVTASPTSTSSTSTSSSSSLSTGAVAGIVIAILFGGISLIGLALFLLSRYNRRHKFTKVTNYDAERAQGSKRFLRHSQRPSVSSEPLMSPASWPPIPCTSRVLSPTRLDSVLPEIRHSAFTLGAFGEMTSDTTIPPTREEPPPSLRPGNDTPPHTPRSCGEVATPSTPPQTLFLHRMLKSRAQASDNVTPTHRSSLPFPPSRSGTVDSSMEGDEERLLTEAEQSAVRGAGVLEGEDDWEEVHTTESMYSQSSAPVDHAGLLSEGVSRENSRTSVGRRKSSRRRPHTPVALAELSPVTEVPDTPRGGTDFPLLASANFGTASTTSGSTCGTLASRYPSLAPSSLGLPVPGGLRNPHSPVEGAQVRQGTVTRLPEVERREVVHGGIAGIDVVL